MGNSSETTIDRIALFGGSFDPVHLGHLELAKAALTKEKLDQVIFIPCWQSPFKGKTIASGEQRLTMLRLAIDELELNWAEVSDFEILRPEPSFSWQTVEHFREAVDDAEWYWILGTDQWNAIEKWAEPEKLRSWLRFIVATRGGQEVEPRKGWNNLAIEFEHPASATRIRETFSEHRDWLPEDVASFCEEEKIYC